MASCQTTQWVSTAPYVKLTVTQSASTETTATLSYTLQYITSYAASTNGVTRDYTIKIGSQSISGSYDINGVTGTKTVKSGTVTVSKATAAQSISFSVSFDFKLTWSGSYKGTLSASSSISVAAKTSYTVSYNANGGSGAPSAQTKLYGTTLTLSDTKPIRTGYAFQGWATSLSGNVTYAAGASYTANAAVTLYAVWELTYVSPKISRLSIVRYAKADDGTYSASDDGISEVILHPPEMGFFELDKGFAVLLTNRTTMRYSKYNKYGQAGATAKHKAGRAYRKIILTLCAKEFYE